MTTNNHVYQYFYSTGRPLAGGAKEGCYATFKGTLDDAKALALLLHEQGLPLSRVVDATTGKKITY
jgi:hypothetical protein